MCERGLGYAFERFRSAREVLRGRGRMCAKGLLVRREMTRGSVIMCVAVFGGRGGRFVPGLRFAEEGPVQAGNTF